MNKVLKRLVRDERGISALEYAILVGVIIVVIVAGVRLLGPQITSLFGGANTAIQGATTPAPAGNN